ncbi:MAG: hypothetical protein H6742_07105 [Alphaproteobacteria bacterium]|nr:hypothetical protein [Alphaproteobacteria bacterium]
MRPSALAALPVLLALPGTAQADGLYLGHTAVEGSRTMAVVGELRTRTDTWVLARIEDRGDHVLVHQTACAMAVRPVAGVRVGMDDDAVRALPASTFRLDRAADGSLVGAPWQTGWGADDLDGDGAPGVSVRVRAPLCGGTLHVASQTTSQARATLDDRGLRGRLQVEVGQEILGADGPCLKVAAKDTVEQLAGPFAYVPAPAGATCDSVDRSAWPDADALSGPDSSGSPGPRPPEG